MLPRLGCRARNFKVKVIRSGNIDHLDVGIADDLSPVSRKLFEPERLLSLACPVLHVISTNDKVRLEERLGEALADLTVRTAVHGAHPPHPDYPDPDSSGHH
jgi:hypothetical protein